MRLQTVPVRTATSAELLPDGILRIRIQRALVNANSGNRSPHWSTKNKSRKEWQNWVLAALVDGVGHAQTLALVGGEDSGLPGANGGLACRCTTKRCQCPASARRRLTITRWVPSVQHFLRDLANRYAVTKECVDALTNLGLLRDDSVKWCDLHVLQNVSADGLFWTEFVIEPTPNFVSQQHIAISEHA